MEIVMPDGTCYRGPLTVEPQVRPQCPTIATMSTGIRAQGGSLRLTFTPEDVEKIRNGHD